MQKNTYVYPAIFAKTATGYCVHFPDLDGCVSAAENLEEAHKMAAEGLGLHLWGMETDNDDIPEPTPIDKLALDDGEVVGLVSVWMVPVRAELDNKAVKKTLTIPSYLNSMAEKKKINFSRVLQTALKKELGL